MEQSTLYILISVALVSIISFIGVLTLIIKKKDLNNVLTLLVSLSIGTLLGSSFLHIIPEISEDGFTITHSIFILLGIILFFALEKFIRWQHCHTSHPQKHPVGIMNLAADAIHNFLDGIIIAAGFLTSTPLGIATSIAVILHEIPQEIGDFGVLLYSGYSKVKALLFNFLIALTSVLGALLTIYLTSYITNITKFLIPIAAGGFIYIASSDLIPELHKQEDIRKSVKELMFIILGIVLMGLLLFIEV
jgi:zinc and cadmium transporter